MALLLAGMATVSPTALLLLLGVPMLARFGRRKNSHFPLEARSTVFTSLGRQGFNWKRDRFPELFGGVLRMALVSLRNDPFGGLQGLQGALEQMLGRPGPPWNRSPSSGTVFPPINVFSDKEGALVIRAEAPGVDSEKLEINVEPRGLTIAGERSVANEGGNGFHRRERRFGRFSRSLQLPADLDSEKASASYADGILTIRIEKAETAKPKRISVSH